MSVAGQPWPYRSVREIAVGLPGPDGPRLRFSTWQRGVEPLAYGVIPHRANTVRGNEHRVYYDRDATSICSGQKWPSSVRSRACARAEHAGLRRQELDRARKGSLASQGGDENSSHEGPSRHVGDVIMMLTPDNAGRIYRVICATT